MESPAYNLAIEKEAFFPGAAGAVAPYAAYKGYKKVKELAGKAKGVYESTKEHFKPKKKRPRVIFVLPRGARPPSQQRYGPRRKRASSPAYNLAKEALL
jgi:hypothetical protein